jgi:cytochrome c-type biogenesis protein CcmH
VKLVSLLLATLVLAAPAWAGARPTAAAIETKLVCPVCHETLDQSTAPIAQEMKAHIRLRLSQGWTEKQILDEMVGQFGPGVLSTPATHGFDLLAWVLPIGGGLVGIAALAAAALYWSRRDPPPPPDAGGGLDPETERRIDLELARFDG